MSGILDVIVQIVSQPALIAGLVSVIGLIALKKPLGEVIKGGLKTTLGFLIIIGGAGIIVGALVPFSSMFEEAFHVKGIIPDDNIVVAAVQQFLGRETALIMVLAFVVNLILARVTPFKYVFLTGHMMWSMAGSMAIALSSFGMSGAPLIITGALIQGAMMVVFPAAMQPLMRKATGTDEVAFGFWGTWMIGFSGWIGKLFGKPEDSTEDLKMPTSLEFFKDMSVFMALVMFLLYLITAMVAGPAFMATLSNGQNYIVFSVIQALTFVAGILVLLQGVRLFIGEIVPAFRGIALKVVPGAKPALDVPIIYPYAPMAVTVGFLSALVGAILSLFITRLWAPVVTLPGVIGIFFMGAAAGVFGNATGGRRGAVAAGFLLGILYPVSVSFFYPLYGDFLVAKGVTGVSLDSPDAVLVLGLMKLVAKAFGH